MRLATIQSEDGDFTINYYTGEVIDLDTKTSDIRKIEYMESIFKFNLHEWQIFYQRGPTENYQLLDLGFWRLQSDQGKYVQANNKWRDENPMLESLTVQTRIVEVKSCKGCPNYLNFSDTCMLDEGITVSLKSVPELCSLPTKDHYVESKFNIDK